MVQDLWTKSSETLFEATKRRAYFKNISILLPESWDRGNYSESTGETYAAVRSIQPYPCISATNMRNFPNDNYNQ